MRSLKSGLVGIALVSFVGVATIVGCSADGSTETITDQPDTGGPSVQLPPPSDNNDDDAATTKDAGKKDAGKDAGKSDGAVDAGPPPPVEGDPCTTPNEIKTKSCGICGKASTICLVDGATKKWGPYGDCASELAGGCAPGTTQACGNCGTQTCNNSCGFGACTGQPPMSCSPGNVELVAASCPAGQYRSKTCKADCTYDNVSLTCQAPPNYITVPAAVGGVNSSVITLSATQNTPRISGTCPSATISTTSTPYNYMEVRNSTAKAVTVSIYQSQAPGGPIPDTIIAAYAGNTAPTTDAARKACLKGVNDFGTTALTGDGNFGSLTTTNVVPIPAGGSVMVYSGNYYEYAAGDSDAAVGLIKLNVKTETIDP
ncbi:MAG: hypothetical protein JWP97_1212 [Labilithrix sp.]|nr:hypothetical protein [Labilithrix sp.]